jgi:hypothetical protein
MLPCTDCLALEIFTHASCFKPLPSDNDEVGTYFVQLVGTFALFINFKFACFWMVCNTLPCYAVFDWWYSCFAFTIFLKIYTMTRTMKLATYPGQLVATLEYYTFSNMYASINILTYKQIWCFYFPCFHVSIYMIHNYIQFASKISHMFPCFR